MVRITISSTWLNKFLFGWEVLLVWVHSIPIWCVLYSIRWCLRVWHSLGDGKYGCLGVFICYGWYLQIIKCVQMTIVCQLYKISFASRLIWLAVFEIGGEHRAWWHFAGINIHGVNITNARTVLAQLFSRQGWNHKHWTQQNIGLNQNALVVSVG